MPETQSILLLLVEDEPLVRMVAHDALDAGGYTVIDAIDGNEGMKILNERASELAGVITDVNLGSGPVGWDVGKHARKLRGDMPILYTTTDSADQWPVRGVPNSLLLQKPYAPAQLLTAISGLITAVDATPKP